MMKLYQKKSASLEDETVLVHLERRHTLKEDANETDSDDHRKKIRANSLDSFAEGPSSTDIEAVPAEKPSTFTRKPTVITESELTSSRLYKDRKAKINSDDESIEDPQPSVSHDDPEDLEPRSLQDPKLKPAPVSNQRSRRVSSCCWYFTIILVICVACLVVMAGVGGIVYLEYFAVDKEKDVQKNPMKNNPLTSKENFQHTTNEQNNFHRNEPIIPENVLKDIIKNSTILSENIDVRKRKSVPSQQNIFRNKEQTDSKIGEVEELDMVENKLVSENQDMKMTENSQILEYTDTSRNIHARFNHFIVPISDKSVELKSNSEKQDSIDLNLNLPNVGNITNKTSDGHVNKVNEQITKNEIMVTEKLNSKENVLDSREETLMFERNLNFDETSTLQEIDSKGEQTKVDTSFLTLPEIHLLPDNSLDHMENPIIDHEVNIFNFRTPPVDNDPEDNSVDNDPEDNSIDHDPEDNSIDHDPEDNSIDHDPEDNSIDHDPEDNSIDHDPEDNSFHKNKHSINKGPKNNSLKHSEQSIVSKDKSLNNSNEDSSDFDSDSFSDKHLQVDDQNQIPDDSTQLVFLRPAVESKAVPIPLAFLRRIGFDIKNANSHQPMSAKDMDIKFSLAEALKYLRSLDSESKLPVSREKTVTDKTSNQKESQKTKLPIKSERAEYLNILRKHIFEENSS